MSNFYSLDEILKYDSQYYIIYGCRSAGKSYAVTRRAIDRFFKYGEEFIIIKRLESQITNRIAGTMLSDHYKYIEETYNKKVRFYSGKWWVYDKDKEGKLSECEIMGYALSLSTVEKSKGSQFPKVETIIFEEFMSIDCKYLNNEINLLLNLVSTVFRHRTTGKIFMLGNSISKYNIYSELLGIHLHKLQRNQIIQKSFRDENGTVTKFTIQRTENVNVEENNRNRDKVVYTNFGKHIDKMINEGKFSSREHNLYKNVAFFFS